MSSNKGSVDWKQLQQQKPHEIVLSGEKISKQIEEENGLNELIYGINSLNFLEITNTNTLCILSTKIEQLSNLTNLILQGNKLIAIPDQIGSLTKLKCLDLSRNELTELPPMLFANLSNLQSLNLEQNQLTSLPDMSKLVSLVVFKCGSNQIEQFPASLCNRIKKHIDPHSPNPIYSGGAIHLSDFEASHNRIDSIPDSIAFLIALKSIDLSDNQIKLVPYELSNCPKLKDVNLNQNPIKDRRLYKLIQQCPTKKVLDYVRANVAPSKIEQQNNLQQVSGDEPSVNEIHRFITIDGTINSEIFRVVVSKTIHPMRKIVACILHGVDLTNPKVMRKFLAIQTKLHQGLCDNRQKATIATHDLAQILPKTTFATAASVLKKQQDQIMEPPPPPPPREVYFDGRVPTKIKFLPLGRTTPVTAMQLYRQLMDEADQYRKEKKRNNISGVHKYLHLLKGKPLYPVLLDSNNNVLSLPPLINSDFSKITPNTKEILIEVTGESIPTCREVMNELIDCLINLEVEGDSGVTLNLYNSSKVNVLNLDGKLATDDKKVHMVIEPVKVVTAENGELIVKYPTKIDINLDNVNVNTIFA